MWPPDPGRRLQRFHLRPSSQLSTLFSFLLSCCRLVTFGDLFFFWFAERSPSPPCGCCSFLRVPFFRLFPVCTLHTSANPRLLRLFARSFLPLRSCLFSFSACSTCYLIPVTCTGYMYSSFSSFFCFVFRFVFACFVSCKQKMSYCIYIVLRIGDVTLNVHSSVILPGERHLPCVPRIGAME